jgi:hypothetical protein
MLLCWASADPLAPSNNRIDGSKAKFAVLIMWSALLTRRLFPTIVRRSNATPTRHLPRRIIRSDRGQLHFVIYANWSACRGRMTAYRLLVRSGCAAYATSPEYCGHSTPRMLKPGGCCNDPAPSRHLCCSAAPVDTDATRSALILRAHQRRASRRMRRRTPLSFAMAHPHRSTGAPAPR